jgi:hypothetical protein
MEENVLNPKDECLTVSVPTAGKWLGLSRGASYAAATRGDLPGLLRIGKRLMVSKAALQRALDNGWQPPKEP